MNTKSLKSILSIVGITLCLPSMAQDIYVNIENEAVQKYLREVQYERNDTSVIMNYLVEGIGRLDLPAPAIIGMPDVEADTIKLIYDEDEAFIDPSTIVVDKGSKTWPIYNLLPQRTYFYKVMADGEELSVGRIFTDGTLRMVYTPHVRNVRDLGGWPCADDKIVRYGKLFRGAELNGEHQYDSIDVDILMNQIGIASELDLRANYNIDNNTSVFGFLDAAHTESGQQATYYYTADSGQLPEHLTTYYYQYRWRREFNFIVDCLKAGNPVYFHCVWGINRTGYLALLLEGLLGVDYSDIVKDYELTSFYNHGEKKDIIDPVLDYIYGLDGATLQDKFYYYFVNKLGVSKDNISYFLNEMLEDKPISTGVFHNPTPYTRHPAAGIYDLQGRPLSNSCTPVLLYSRTPALLIEVCDDGSVRKIIR